MRSSSPVPLLSLAGLSKRFGSQLVLDGIDLDVAEGETVCILGPSGSGKSTLLRCVNWLERPDSGAVTLEGQPIGIRPDGRFLSDRQLSRLRTRLGMVFQSFALWPHLTAIENVMESPLHVQRRAKADVRVEAAALLDRVGLSGKHDAYPSALSGGQKQRVGIARALAVRPPIIMFDEPTSALDPELVGEVLNVMRDLAKQGQAMLVVTHEMHFAREVADRIVFMDEGRIVETAPPEVFFTHPRTERARSFLARHRAQTGGAA
ncbi:MULTISPECIES: amino acid ABC transporter ATP-binding protein [unclassified Aureimonas]|uniref:amino acid ABC transporter ATP-binding protein n=1 Tax=unclassified Aureimonas TaxID=2615206 RepID=UPI0006F649CE|nr:MULTISPECIES: amino acid ABC transporter ATP-binding protein [unclassified Aureimonas]KQT63976.1 glutamate ABC transporter ATP-binding protein [Aureimonas sp. Leaf427]KQT81169.1 glutamate ABC transporter ATP-binding protein [Aureimonas sp. Leaf460]